MDACCSDLACAYHIRSSYLELSLQSLIWEAHAEEARRLLQVWNELRLHYTHAYMRCTHACPCMSAIGGHKSMDVL